MERLFAVRGAVTVPEDTREHVISQTQALLKELLGRNQIDAERIVSIIFTATDDIHSEFPAAAARLLGLNGIPLLCARELEVTSRLTMRLCIRVLVHFYGTEHPDPVYLGETVRLLDPPDPA
ncbi:MAG: chorismate mutase [Actinomycetota bacterium]